MEKTFDFLKKRTSVNYLATVDGGLQRLRPFGDPVLFDGKIYVLTMKDKAVSRQIAQNDHACIEAYDGEEWIRANCRLVDDSDNVAAKEAVVAEFPWAKVEGYTLDNPNFQILCFAEADCTIYTEDGEELVYEKF